jgi:hypothetical protein
VSQGGDYITIDLKNPSGTVVQSWTDATAGPYTYYATGAPAGVWTWVFTYVSSVAAINQGSDYTSTYNATVSGTISWYA